MDEKEKSGRFKRFFDRVTHTNRENYSPGAENNARLDYKKGNIDQNQEKIAGVWDTCPVLDEQGNPIEENSKV